MSLNPGHTRRGVRTEWLLACENRGVRSIKKAPLTLKAPMKDSATSLWSMLTGHPALCSLGVEFPHVHSKGCTA